ncbi:YceI family protein [Solitalea koreensis]|uniref:YceI-like domain-containing protein n=1 Tax=Solitalea koreensis TaxID=543615 RepID=A0A521DYD4_9SPHI|nr:YceI family protein [Solitalea koreensis]SMO76618.1 YceI-like domain-containing protein [Solitalea koreensis]
MKYSKIPPLALVFLLLNALVAFGQKAYILKSHKMSVTGTSTMHDWTETVKKVDWSGNITTEGTGVKAISDVVVKIAVKDLKSEKGGTMDNKTYEAFKSDKFPTITFKLTSATVSGAVVKANGTLTMAGVSKPIALNVTSKVLADGSVQLSGSQAINMKEFNMAPPKAVMGTIKVGEKVTFHYELIVLPKT